jgi:tetratricopeptide (TPR) repeat protein
MSRDKPGLQRFQGADDPAQQAQAWLEAGRIVARQGDTDEARRLFHAAAKADPGCTEAWLQLALLAQNRREREVLLRRVLVLEPGHVQARAELARLRTPAPSSGAARRSYAQRMRRWTLGLLVVAAALFLLVLLVWGPVDRSLAGLLPTPTPFVTPTPTLTPAQLAAQFEPQLQAALSSGNWERALELVAIMLSVDPVGEAVKDWALAAHMQYGQTLVQAGQMDEALVQFESGLTLVPDDAEAQLWRQVTQMYLRGQEALKAGDWPTAIEVLTEAHQLMADYGDLADLVIEAYRRHGQAAIEAEDWTTAIKSLTAAHTRRSGDPELVDLLATAYRERGIVWQGQGDLQQARADLESALVLVPEDQKAKTHYDEVMYILFPPKRIEIDISRQRFYAWLGDRLIYEFPTSTGLPGRDTAAGHYKVLDKIPMAYSSIWRLKMPYWLGIYYVGNIENGIHALPIRPDGTVMWGGLLGQKASYGCVILSTQAARLIYEWAEIGTPVHIHY